MRKKKNGLVLIIGSVAGRVSIPFQSHYSSCKYALEAYAEALRLEIMPYGVHVSIIEQGDTKTGFTRNRKTDCKETSCYYEVCTKAVKRMEHDEQNGREADSVAKVAFAWIIKMYYLPK